MYPVYFLDTTPPVTSSKSHQRRHVFTTGDVIYIPPRALRVACIATENVVGVPESCSCQSFRPLDVAYTYWHLFNLQILMYTHYILNNCEM